MKHEHVNAVMDAALGLAPGEEAALMLAVGAARLAERRGLPLLAVLRAVAAAYRVSARLAGAGR